MKVKLLTKGAKAPARIDEGAAGYDLYTPFSVVIEPGRNVVPLNIKIELDPGTEAQIRPRSGFSAKGMEGHDVEDPLGRARPRDADVIIGTVDCNYRGNVGVIVKSCEKEPFVIKAGTRIAQMVIAQHVSKPFEVSAELSDTDRGEGGFGSTGTT